MADKKEPKAKKPAKKKGEAGAAAFVTKKFKDFVISQKRSGRYLVRNASGKTINGLEKAKILVDAKLVQAGFAKAKEEAAPTA